MTNKLRIEQLLKESFAGRFDDESLANGKNYLLYRVCLKLVDEFLKQELALVKEDETRSAQTKILMLETEMIQPIIVSNFTVNIRGKVDRVEEKNDIINIADYKTGSDSGNKLNVDDIKQLPDTPKFSKAMQLLMYAWMYWSANGKQEINLRSGIYWLRNSGKGFDTLELDGNDVITKSILESFENVLCAVIEKLLSPDIPFAKTEDIKRCTYCEFAKICRREKPDSNF